MSSSRDDFTIAIRSALLQKGTRQKFSILFLFCISIIIFFLDVYNFRVIAVFKSVINDGVYRVSNLSTSPVTFFHFSKNTIHNHFQVYNENKILKAELEKLKSKDLNINFNNTISDSLKRANEINKQILGKNIVAKVLLDKDSPYLKSIIINKGSKSGVKKGMPVLDGTNLVGRIVEVNYISSRVLLLNDLNSRIPVVISGTGAQAILVGKGDNNPVLEYLPENYIIENDVSVFTSGKDGIFSPGVAIGSTNFLKDTAIVKLFSDPNQLSFVSVKISSGADKVGNF